MSELSALKSLKARLDNCTYSFDGREKMCEAIRVYTDEILNTPRPSGDLVERIKQRIVASEMSMARLEKIETDSKASDVKIACAAQEAATLQLNLPVLRDCLTALQGVTISRECAKSIIAPQSDTEYQNALSELTKALEHSNGR